jgi:2-dehydropantoate 2-reductase
VRIAVFGSGAVGGYFGGRLAEAGEDVAFIARGKHLAAIRRSGLRVTSLAGDFVVHPARVTDDPSSLGPVDVVLLGVKAWQVSQAVGALQPLVGSRTIVVPLQNGIEAPERLAAGLGVEHVLGGLCRIIAYLVAPGQLRHAGADPYIAFGPLDPATRDRAEALRAAFGRARGVVVEIPSDIRVAMWSKFLFIAALSGVGALTRAPVGVIRDQPECRRLLHDALTEIHRVATAHGIMLPGGVVEQTLAYLDSLPPEGTASMQRDIVHGRPSELDAQVGAVVRLGERAGVDVPLHRIILSALLPLERRARGELAFTVPS